MKRKLFSTTLCALSLLLLMGAGVEPASFAAAANKEEGTQAAQSQVLENEVSADTEQTQEDAQSEQTAEEVVIVDTANIPQMDPKFLIDGQPVQADTGRMWVRGNLYVALGPTVRELDPSAQYSWDSKSKTATVTTDKLTLTAKVGNVYAVANGRYLYIQNKVKMQNDQVYIPLRIITRAFGAEQTYDDSTGIVHLKRGSGTIQSGDSFYNKEKLFWLSRVIQAESGNQSLKGKMAVGNVVMNRVKSKKYPNTIVGVLAQKNQFSTYKDGALANRKPSQSSVIAAKLVLDGAVVAETRGALFFDSKAEISTSGSKKYICKLGDHNFYR